MAVVLYECETLILTLREEHELLLAAITLDAQLTR